MLTRLPPVPLAHPQSCRGGHLHLGTGPGRASPLQGCPDQEQGQGRHSGRVFALMSVPQLQAKSELVWPQLNVWAPWHHPREQCFFRRSPETPWDSHDWKLVGEQKPSPASCWLPNTHSLTLHPTLPLPQPYTSFFPASLSPITAQQDKAAAQGGLGTGPGLHGGEGEPSQTQVHRRVATTSFPEK